MIDISDLPPPPSSRNRTAAPSVDISDLPPPPAATATGEWEDNARLPELPPIDAGKPSTLGRAEDVAEFGAGMAYGAVKGGAKGVWGAVKEIPQDAFEVVKFLGTDSVLPDGTLNPDAQKYLDDWFGTKKFYEGGKEAYEGVRNFMAMPASQREEIINHLKQQYNDKSSFQKGQLFTETGAEIGASFMTPSLLKKGSQVLKAPSKLSGLIESTRGAVRKAESEVTTAQEGAKQAQGVYFTQASKAEAKAEALKQQAEQYAHDLVAKKHGEGFPVADNISTPAGETLPATANRVITEALATTDKARAEAGSLIQDWETELDSRQQQNPGGFWGSTVGREWRRKLDVRLLRREPRPGEPVPKFAPSQSEKSFIESSYERIRGREIPGIGRRIPVTAKTLQNEIEEAGAEIERIRKSSGSKNKIQEIIDYRESLIEAIEKYTGKTYPRAPYKEAARDMRRVMDTIGAKKLPALEPGGPARWKFNSDPKKLFASQESYQALVEVVGEKTANTLAERYISNSLKGKGPEQAVKWLTEQNWLGQASPQAFEKALTYVDGLAINANDIKTQVAIAKASHEAVKRFGTQIKKMGEDRVGVLRKVQQALSGKTGQAMLQDWYDLVPNVNKSGAMKDEQIQQMTRELQQIAKIQDASERNKNLVKLAVKYSGMGAGAFGAEKLFGMF